METENGSTIAVPDPAGGDLPADGEHHEPSPSLGSVFMVLDVCMVLAGYHPATVRRMRERTVQRIRRHIAYADIAVDVGLAKEGECG